jgi:hypothetical protein
MKQKKTLSLFVKGDKVNVVDVTKGNKIINTGEIVFVAPLYVIFEGQSETGKFFQWKFERKGITWVQVKKEYAHLIKINK